MFLVELKLYPYVVEAFQVAILQYILLEHVNLRDNVVEQLQQLELQTTMLLTSI